MPFVQGTIESSPTRKTVATALLAGRAIVVNRLASALLKMKLLLILLLALSSLTANAITAKSYIVIDLADGKVLLEKNADEVRPIASITKLVTALSASAYSSQQLIEITQSDVDLGQMRSSPLRAGQSYTRAQLIELALVASDNIAAIALGRVVFQPLTFLPETMQIYEASGLDPFNVSTARDIARFASWLLDTEIAKTSVKPIVEVDGQIRRSTNPYIEAPGWNFRLSKTGFIKAAGGCLVTAFDVGGKSVIAVILGSSGNHGRWRDLLEIRQKLQPRKPVTIRGSRYNWAKPDGPRL